MEEEMELEPVFVAHEIDIDYEFDAARFFDFTREETLAEARQAELWFESAQSYPPSPFVAKMVLREHLLTGNVSASPGSKDGESAPSLLNYSSDTHLGPVFTGAHVNKEGLMLNDKKFTSKLNGETKSSSKPSFPRSSTLMKPTASQLAKQNRPCRGGPRTLTSMVQNKEKNLCNSTGLESQAPKRQKLEGGLLRKVADTNRQTSLFHKEPNKEGFVEKNSVRGKMKLTIPREPNLVTAVRAQRTRLNRTEPEHTTTNVRHFKARPLNRKILEAPSLPLPKKSTPKLPMFKEFYLKTQERALQHGTAVNSSLVHCGSSDKGNDAGNESMAEDCHSECRRVGALNDQKQDGCDMLYNFNAHPLSQKDFNFHAEKRTQHIPPVELFSKLSLKSELQPINGPHLKVPRPSSVYLKGFKENRVNSSQPQNEVAHSEGKA